MLIAVTAGAGEASEYVPETYEESDSLYIIETETASVTAQFMADEGRGMRFAEKTAEYRCEAVACGRFTQKSAFEAFADRGITRYFAAGLPILEAAAASEQSVLPLMTEFEGKKTCSHHRDNPEE